MIERIRAAFRARLWPLPLLAVLAAVALGVVVPVLDETIDTKVPGLLEIYVFSGGPEAARAVLQAVSGSLITVTSLTFSLTVVTLQLASSQFSPRLLRTFTSDRFVHWTLALFLGTFSYSLTVLRSVRSGADSQDPFVPGLAVMGAFVLALASVVALVFFLAHLTREIRVETMMKNVHAETAATIERVIPERPGSTRRLRPGTVGVRVPAAKSGFLTSVDAARLAAAAGRAGAVVRIDSLPGDSLVAGVPFATIWAAGPGARISPEGLHMLRDAINKAAVVGFERTNEQDPGFGFRQLADVAARALSPGTNDPTTAVHVLGHLSSLLCLVSSRDLVDEVVEDGHGAARVILARPGFDDYLFTAVSQARHYGCQDPVVALRLLALFDEVNWCDRSGRHSEALHKELSAFRESLELHDYASHDKRALLERYEQVRLAVSSAPAAL